MAELGNTGSARQMKKWTHGMELQHVMMSIPKFIVEANMILRNPFPNLVWLTHLIHVMQTFWA